MYVTDRPTGYDARWVAHVPARSKNSGYDRLVSAGSTVLLGDPLVIQHCVSSELLSSDRAAPVATDFGPEFEVRAQTELGNGRVGTLREEFRGAKTGATGCRPELEQNIWAAVVLSVDGVCQHVTATSTIIPLQPTLNGIAAKVQDTLRRRGLLSLRILNRELFFAAAENGREMRLSRDVMSWILWDCGVRLDKEHFQVLCQNCGGDSVSDDTVDVSMLMAVLRGELSDDRKLFIFDIFSRLKSDPN